MRWKICDERTYWTATHTLVSKTARPGAPGDLQRGVGEDFVAMNFCTIPIGRIFFSSKRIFWSDLGLAFTFNWADFFNSILSSEEAKQ